MTGSPRIAVFAHGGHADGLRAVPFVRALRDAHREASITVFGHAHSASLWDRCPHIDAFVATSSGSAGRGGRAGWRKVPQAIRLAPALLGRFDLTINLDVQPQGGRSGLLGLLSLAPRRAGFGARRNGVNVSPGSADMRVSYEERCRTLLEAIGVPAGDGRLEAWAGPDDRRRVRALLTGQGWDGRRPLFVFQTGSDWSCQMWPARRWTELSDRLVERFGALVAFTGVVADRTFVETIRADLHCKSLDVTGSTGYGELTALLEQAALVVSTDTLVAPLAAAMGAAVVTLPAYDTSNWSAERMLELGLIARYRELPGIKWSARCHWHRSGLMPGCESPSCVGLHGMGRITVGDVVERVEQVLSGRDLAALRKAGVN